MRRLLTAVALLALLALAPASLADPTGRSTLQETVRPRRAAAASCRWCGAAGEAYVVRRGGSARARARARRPAPLARVLRAADRPADRRRDVAGARRLRRSGRRRAQGRAAPAGGARPAGVRRDRAQRQRATGAAASATGAAGARGCGFALTTGDLADNQQLNETRWFRTVLDGGRIDPFSGKPVGPGNPCSGVARHDRAAQRRRRGPALHRPAGLRRLARRARPTATPASGIPTRRRRRPGRTPRSRATRACWSARRCRSDAQGLDVPVAHLARQPRRAAPGQRAGEHGPVPGDRGRLHEDLPERGDRPGAVRRRRRGGRVRALQRPGVHRDAARRGPPGAAGPGPPDRLEGRSTAT